MPIIQNLPLCVLVSTLDIEHQKKEEAIVHKDVFVKHKCHCNGHFF